MSKIKRIELELDESGHAWHYLGDMQTYLCHDRMMEFFDIPKKTKKIWLVLSDAPLDNGYKCQFEGRCFGDLQIELSSSHLQYVYIMSGMRCMIEDIFEDAPFYAAVEC